MKMPYRVHVTGVIHKFSSWDDSPIGTDELDYYLGPYRVRSKCELEIERDRKGRAQTDRELGWRTDLEYVIERGREEVVVTEIWEPDSSV